VTAWGGQDLVGFDLETTGVDVETDRIVTAAVVVWTRSPEVATWEWLLNPGVEIPPGASAVHGITTEDAQAGMDPRQALAQIAGHLVGAVARSVPIVAFNAAFDLTMLDRELRRHDLPPLIRSGDYPGLVSAEAGFRVLDPHILDKSVDRYRRGKRTLSATCEHYKVESGAAHTAVGDAVSALRLVKALADRYPAEIGDRSFSDLHEFQVREAQVQADSFREYLGRQIKSVDNPADEEHLRRRVESVDGSWPIRPLREVTG
jgi:DNA polymerase-3 subunit epsilon